MGNCCCRLFKINSRVLSSRCQKKIVLLLVGLDNAGKTSAAKGLTGESLDTVVPTVGFSSVSLMYRKHPVIIYDLGGGPQIRGIWHRYFVDVHGIMFVVDASDQSRLDECRKVLENLLTHKKLSGKPVLLLANKQDQQGALDELDIVEKLNLEKLVNEQRCPTMVETCSAAGSKRKLDPAIRHGYKWLLNCILRDYDALNSRVEADVAEQKLVIEREKAERLERVLKTQSEGGSGDCNQDDEENFVDDPFRPITDLTANLEKGNNKENHNGMQNGGAALGDNLIVKRDPLQCVDVDESELVSTQPALTQLIKEQLEMEVMNSKPRKFLRRSNKTGPAPLDHSGPSSPRKEEPQASSDIPANRRLPPLRQSSGSADKVPWAQAPLNGPSRAGRLSLDAAWDLDKSLEVVAAASNQTEGPT